MEQITLEAGVREKLTKGERNRIRREGGVLANLYGKTVQATPIFIKPQSIKTFEQHHGHGLIQLNVEGQGSFSAMVNEIERSPLSKKILHVDFHAVNMSETVDVEVALALEGIEEVEKKGGIVQQQLREVQLRALPQDVPEQILVDIRGLKIGDSLHVGQISLPERCTLKSDADQVIVTVIAPKNTDLDETTEVSEPELVKDTEDKGAEA